MKEVKKSEKKEKNPALSNIAYMMGLLWKSDKFFVCYSFYKQIAEQAFYVIFYVYMTQFIYTCIEKQSPFNELFWFVVALSIGHVIVHIVSAGHAYAQKRRSPLIYLSIYNKVIDKATKMEYKRFQQPDFYDKFTRALSESVNRGIQMMSSVVYCFASGISAALAMIVVVQVDPVLLLFVIPSVIASLYFGRKIGQAEYELDFENTRDTRAANYTKRVFFEKKYAGELRLYSIKNVLFGRHKKAYAELYARSRKFRRKIALYNALRWGIFVAMSLSLPMIYVAFVVKSTPGISVAPYVAMVTAIEFVSGNISDCIDKAIEAVRNALFVKNLRQFIQYEPIDIDHADVIPESLDDIEISHVGFTYEGASAPTLRDVNISIRKGERIALVGHNGAGKTTLIQLLMKLYDVSEGEIRISGRNIREYEASSYHEHFGTVFQDLQVFALTVCQNVIMRDAANDEERRLVEESLIKAQFGEKLETLKKDYKGIDTMVSKEFDDNGAVLSGGETQKIAIARVFAKNPDIVILDEPSSALDPIAEYNMYNNMLQLGKDKTVIFISHRLSSARVADRIFFLENGTVTESGTHDELMAKNGGYAEMFNLQAQNYQDSLPAAAEREVTANA